MVSLIPYDERAGTSFDVLPTQRRLRDYENYIIQNKVLTMK